jgi:hypothetical protein
MKRDDSLSRQIGRTQRRKRRNLANRGVETPWIGGGGDGDGCPNIGPPEAAQEFRTASGAGSIQGHVYTDVILESTGLIAGVDVLTYCFDAWVGGPANPTDLSCDGTLGLLKSGILSKPNWLNQPKNEGWTVYGDAWGVQKDGWNALAMYPTEGLCPLTRVYYEGGTQNVYLQTYCTFEGTYGVDGRYATLGQFLSGNLWTQTRSDPNQFAGINHPKIYAGAAIGAIQQGNGIFAGVTYALTGTDTGTQSLGLLRAFSVWDGGDDGTTSYTMFGSTALSSDPLPTGSSSRTERAAYLEVYSDCETTLLNETRPKSDEVGRVWYYNTVVMDHKDAFFTGLPDGYYVRLTDGQYGSMQSITGSSGGELRVQPIHRYWFTEGDTDRPQWTGEWPMHHVEIWNGEPDVGTLVKECDIGRGVYGGDVWDYDSAGHGGTAPANVTSTIRLQFLSSANNVIATYEPTGSASTTATLITQADITVPANTQRMRFTQFKRGTGDGFGVVDNLQVNNGPICCPFTNPTFVAVPQIGGTDYDSVNEEDDGTGGETIIDPTDVDLALDEHRKGGGNLIVESRDERTITAGTGNLDGDDYPRVTLSEHGIQPGDVISIRGKAKAT